MLEAVFTTRTFNLTFIIDHNSQNQIAKSNRKVLYKKIQSRNTEKRFIYDEFYEGEEMKKGYLYRAKLLFDGYLDFFFV